LITSYSTAAIDDLLTRTIDPAGMTLAYETALTHQIIGLAMRVHTRLGPGMLENAYERCLCHE
jgi:hypothetical protein